MTTKISTLPTLTTVTDATIIPVVEGGATKRITGLALKTYTGTASGPQGPSGPSGATGSNGSAGATGPQGPSGPSGPGTLNSGTAGYVPYYSGSTALSAPTSGRLFWDNTNGALGIADTSPYTSASRLSISPPYPPSGAGYLPAVKLSAGFDNQGSQDNAGIFLQYGGGQAPGGTLLTAKTGAHTSFVLNNCGSDNNIFNAGGRPNVYIYSGPTYSSYGQPNSAVNASGYLPRMGIYSEMTGMYDGAILTGLGITLAGSYGGNGTRDVICSAVKSTTNFGSDKGYGTNYGYWANISGNTTANYAFYSSAGDAAKPGGGSWASSSDARVKTVVGEYARGLADVVQLRVVDFQYNGRAETPTDGRTYTGLIAQEAIEVMPEMVHTRNAKLDPEDTSETSVYMVDNSALVYALVNSVKELKALVDSQAARIAQLEGK